MRNHHSVAIQRARSLRQEATLGERVLWGALRRNRLGLHFRRQHPVAGFITDFCCLTAKLVVEVDGITHAGRARQDSAREAALEALGFQILRVTECDARSDPAAVLEAIERMTRSAATAPLSRAGGGAAERTRG